MITIRRPLLRSWAAKNVCNGVDGQRVCPYRNDCSPSMPIDNGEGYGVWGGTSERDRKKTPHPCQELL